MKSRASLNAVFTQDFLTGVVDAMGDKTAAAEELEKYIAEHSFDASKVPPEDSHILFYNGVPIGSRGNLLAITGKAKSRKTVVASAVGTACFAQGGFLGFTADLAPDDRILHIDTEQGYYHYYGTVMRIFRDAGVDPPPNFKSVHTRDATVPLRIQLVDYLLEKLSPRVVIIDGITDFVYDINKQEEATALQEKLLGWSYKYDCLIVVIIHTTKTTGYMTGAVGTTLEKKAQTVIKVEKDEKDEGVSHISCQYARDIGFKTWSIHFDEELGRYDVLPETAIVQKGKKGDKSPDNYLEEVHKKVITRLFGYSLMIPDDQILGKLWRAARQVTGDELDLLHQRKWMKYYNERAWIFQGPDGAWMRPAPGTTSNHTGPGETGLFDAAPPANPLDQTDDLPF